MRTRIAGVLATALVVGSVRGIERIDLASGKRTLVAAPAPVDRVDDLAVAASGSHVIVSGGTSELSLRRYDAAGGLSEAPATADFGRGQPDILLASGGRVAPISTHVQGPRFGITVADITDQPLALQERGYMELPGAGFTAGGFRPANFPLQSVALDATHLVVAMQDGGVFIQARMAPSS